MDVKYLELVLDFIILFVLLTLFIESRERKAKLNNEFNVKAFEHLLSKTLGNLSIKPEIQNVQNGGRASKQSNKKAVKEIEAGEGSNNEKAYDNVIDLLDRGYSIEKIAKEVKEIPEGEIKMIAVIRRERNFQ